jgi:membrane protease YdiL (CAAX protease family)
MPDASDRSLRMMSEPRHDGRGDTAPARREQLVEVLVFLSLILPSMVLSLFVIRQGTVGFVPTAVATIARDLALVGLILFLLSRNGEQVARIGWRPEHAATDAVLGVVLFVPLFVGTGALEQLLLRAGFAAPSTPLPRFLTAVGTLDFALAPLLVAVVAVAEETIFRGYLILRLTAVTGSTRVAVVLSSFIFSLGHGYEGTAGLTTVAVMGLMLALVYVWRRSLVAPIVMHFLQDVLGIVVFPLLGVH